MVRSYQRDAHRSIGRLFKLSDPAFVAYGKAFALVLQQATHPDRGPAQEEWQAVVDELHVLGHHLMGGALKWHQSLVAPLDELQSVRSTADAFLRDEGCLHPQRLMDIILPLPCAEH